MRKKNRALVPSMNLDTPHPMNAAAGLCVLLRIGGRPFAARPRSAPWVQAGRGCRLTASVNLTAFERCDRRHKLPHHFLDTAWTAMAAAHPDRGGIPHNTGAGMVRSRPPYAWINAPAVASHAARALPAAV